MDGPPETRPTDVLPQVDTSVTESNYTPTVADEPETGAEATLDRTSESAVAEQVDDTTVDRHLISNSDDLNLKEMIHDEWEEAVPAYKIGSDEIQFYLTTDKETVCDSSTGFTLKLTNWIQSNAFTAVYNAELTNIRDEPKKTMCVIMKQSQPEYTDHIDREFGIIKDIHDHQRELATNDVRVVSIHSVLPDIYEVKLSLKRKEMEVRLMILDVVKGITLQDHLDQKVSCTDLQIHRRESHLKDSLNIVISLCEAVHFLHAGPKIAHFDLNGGNIMVDRDTCKIALIDFGQGKRLVEKTDEAKEELKRFDLRDIFTHAVALIDFIHPAYPAVTRTKPEARDYEALSRWMEEVYLPDLESDERCSDTYKAAKIIHVVFMNNYDVDLREIAEELKALLAQPIKSE